MTLGVPTPGFAVRGLLLDGERKAIEPLAQRVPRGSVQALQQFVGPESVDEAVTAAKSAGAILLDSGNQRTAVKELGGTGRTHDWAVSRRIREAVSVPVFLAGGLNPGNVREALRQVGPFALDVCSGVRSDGALDRNKLQEFFRQIGGDVTPA